MTKSRGRPKYWDGRENAEPYSRLNLRAEAKQKCAHSLTWKPKTGAFWIKVKTHIAVSSDGQHQSHIFRGTYFGGKATPDIHALRGA